MEFSMLNFIRVGLLSKFIQLVMSLKGNVIFKQQNLQILTAASWQDVALVEKWENFKLPPSTFCSFFRNLSRIRKENHLSKKSRGHRTSKRVKSKQS